MTEPNKKLSVGKLGNNTAKHFQDSIVLAFLFEHGLFLFLWSLATKGFAHISYVSLNSLFLVKASSLPTFIFANVKLMHERISGNPWTIANVLFSIWTFTLLQMDACLCLCLWWLSEIVWWQRKKGGKLCWTRPFETMWSRNISWSELLKEKRQLIWLKW